MALAHNIYPEHSLVYVLVDGPVPVDEFAPYFFAIADQDERFVLGMDTLLDGRRSELPPYNPAETSEFQEFADKIKKEHFGSPARKHATVVANSGTFGVTRQRSVFMNEVDNIEMGIFYDIETALEWLGVPIALANGLSAPISLKP